MANTQRIIEILIKARDEASANLEKVKKSIQNQEKGFKKSSTAIGKYEKAQKNLFKTNKNLNNALIKTKKGFDGAALSVMFFGMAMTRVATKIWTQGTKTFQDIMHSVKGTVTQFDMLNAASEQTKYSLGAALEPLAAAITPIVMALSDWISEHEQLVRDITVAFGVGGAILTAFGIVKLGLAGLTDKWGDFFLGFQNLKNRDWSGAATQLKTAINTAVGVISLVWALKAGKDAYDSFKSGDIADGILNSLSMGAFAGAFITTGLARGVLFAIGIGLQLVEDNKFFSSIMTIAGIVGALFGSIVESIGNMFAKGIENMINEVMGYLRNIAIIKLGASMIGLDLGDVSLAKDFDFKSDFKNSLKQWMQQGKEWDAIIKEAKSELDVPQTVQPGLGGFTPVSEARIPQQPQYLNFYGYSTEEIDDIRRQANNQGE